LQGLDIFILHLDPVALLIQKAVVQEVNVKHGGDCIQGGYCYNGWPTMQFNTVASLDFGVILYILYLGSLVIEDLGCERGESFL
jgi:hypothetical protein